MEKWQMKFFKKIFDKALFYVNTDNNKLSVFALAIPLFISNVSVHFIGMVQTMIASRYLGGFFVIPISVSNTLTTVMVNILAMVSTGMTILLSVFLGKKDYDACKKIIGCAIILCAFLFLVVFVIGFVLARPLLLLMGMNNQDYAQYMPYTVTYFRVRHIGLIFSALYLVVYGALQCYGHTKVGLICSLVSNLVSVVATLVAIYLFNLQKEQAATVFALITVVSSAISLIMAWVFIRQKKIKISFAVSYHWIKSILKVGAPASLAIIFYCISQTVTTSICLLLTSSEYLAKNYVAQIVYLVYVFGYSLGQANSIMVGRICGMGDLDRVDRMHRQNLRLVMAINFALSLLFFSVGVPLIKLMFGADNSVLSFVTGVMAIDVLVELGRGMNHVGQNGLNATGDVRFTTVISILSCWICSVGFAYILGITFNLGLYGIWLAFAIDELFRGTLYYLRWKKQGWRKAFSKI